MALLLIGKSGICPLGAYSNAESYYIGDLVEDAEGNWFTSKTGTKTPDEDKPNKGNALPVPNAQGVITDNANWHCALNVTAIKLALNTYANSSIEEHNRRANLAIESAEEAVRIAQQASEHASGVDAAIQACEEAAEKANSSVSIADPATAEAMWSDYDFTIK